MPCRAVSATDAATDGFLKVVEIATRAGFIFVLPWYRVVSGVQFKTPSVRVRGF
jgi:hypothetical protein